MSMIAIRAVQAHGDHKSVVIHCAFGRWRPRDDVQVSQRSYPDVTTLEANLLVRSHGLVADEVESFMNFLWMHGVRRETRERTSVKRMIASVRCKTQCPPGTGGGSRAYL